jgi:hypothetical protein
VAGNGNGIPLSWKFLAGEKILNVFGRRENIEFILILFSSLPSVFSEVS